MTADETTRHRGTPERVDASTTDQGTRDESIVRGATDTSSDPAAVPCRKCGHTPDLPEIHQARLAVKRVQAAVIRRQAVVDSYVGAFLEAWGGLSLPPRWRRSVVGLQSAGLPRNVMVGCVHIAVDADHVPTSRLFRYFVSVGWNRVHEMRDAAVDLAYAFDDDGRRS